VQLAPRPESTSHDLGSAPSRSTAPVGRLLVAGFALVGAGLVAANPVVSTMPEVQHRAVQLTAGEEDWSQVLTAAQDNLTTLESEAATANTELSSAFSALSNEFGGQISTALTGAESGLENSISGGWYGGDDGYVFGLFPGSVTGPDGTETGSTLEEISSALQSGQLEQAYSYFDTWSLESLDHTLKSLVSPLLDVTSHGSTTLSIPVELSQLQTNLLETFGTYTELKSLGDAALSPEISLLFGLSGDLETIGTDFSSGDYTQGLTDLENLSSDVTGDLLNGFQTTNPVDGSTEPFTGLLNSGSLLDDLLVTWPTQLATALGESTAAASAESVTSTLPDLVSGLLSL
jgi:hypothetical protein